MTTNVRVAQLDRAFGYGPKGRGFESFHARFKNLVIARKTKSTLNCQGAFLVKLTMALCYAIMLRHVL